METESLPLLLLLTWIQVFGDATGLSYPEHIIFFTVLMVCYFFFFTIKYLCVNKSKKVTVVRHGGSHL